MSRRPSNVAAMPPSRPSSGQSIDGAHLSPKTTEPSPWRRGSSVGRVPLFKDKSAKGAAAPFTPEGQGRHRPMSARSEVGRSFTTPGGRPDSAFSRADSRRPSNASEFFGVLRATSRQSTSRQSYRANSGSSIGSGRTASLSRETTLSPTFPSATEMTFSHLTQYKPMLSRKQDKKRTSLEERWGACDQLIAAVDTEENQDLLQRGLYDRVIAATEAHFKNAGDFLVEAQKEHMRAWMASQRASNLMQKEQRAASKGPPENPTETPVEEPFRLRRGSRLPSLTHDGARRMSNEIRPPSAVGTRANPEISEDTGPRKYGSIKSEVTQAPAIPDVAGMHNDPTPKGGDATDFFNTLPEAEGLMPFREMREKARAGSRPGSAASNASRSSRAHCLVAVRSKSRTGSRPGSAASQVSVPNGSRPGSAAPDRESAAPTKTGTDDGKLLSETEQEAARAGLRSVTSPLAATPASPSGGGQQDTDEKTASVERPAKRSATTQDKPTKDRRPRRKLSRKDAKEDLTLRQVSNEVWETAPPAMLQKLLKMGLDLLMSLMRLKDWQKAEKTAGDTLAVLQGLVANEKRRAAKLRELPTPEPEPAGLEEDGPTEGEEEHWMYLKLSCGVACASLGVSRFADAEKHFASVVKLFPRNRHAKRGLECVRFLQAQIGVEAPQQEHTEDELRAWSYTHTTRGDHLRLMADGQSKEAKEKAAVAMKLAMEALARSLTPY
eukprot:TRINITY_DN16407_c0_g1_i1.p1 TRINITY_DN16407_c0_g1~~TRINITY_DN16407_c0_g1_i1.p1  ORF type:complete len:767 (-),score=143.64 TRINITY_DN16407_c0_g1_i1:376-2544(-)